MRFLLLTVLYVAPAAYCISDAVQHPDREPYGLPKVLWVLMILLFPLVGAGAWLLVKFRTAARLPRPQGPAGPEDDPEFQRWLRERERRRRDES